MANIFFNAALALAFPVTLLFGRNQVLSHASGRTDAMNHGCERTGEAPTPLNLRWFCYGTEAVKAYWSWLKPAGRQAEDTFLTLNLLFPFLYGGALAVSVRWVWMATGRPFHPAWILTPLAIVIVADWTEHLIQLAQLRYYLSPNGRRVQDLWIRMSGCATIIKLWLTSGLYVSLARLVISMIVTYSTRRMMTNATE